MTTTWLASHFCFCRSVQFILCPIICLKSQFSLPSILYFLSFSSIRINKSKIIYYSPLFISRKRVQGHLHQFLHSTPFSPPTWISFLFFIPFFRWINFNFLAYSAFTFSCIFFISLEHRSITFADEASPSKLRFSVSSWFRRLCSCVVRSFIDFCTSPIITSIRFISASSCACSFAAVCSRRAKTPPAALPTPLRSSARLPTRCSHAVADSAALAASSLSSVAEGGLEMKSARETHSWGLAARREALDRPSPSR